MITWNQAAFDLIDDLFSLPSHGMQELCPVVSFIEVDGTVTFMVSFMSIFDCSLARNSKTSCTGLMSQSAALIGVTCFLPISPAPSHSTLSHSLCSSYTDILVFESTRLIPASELGHGLFLQPYNVLLHMKASPHYWSFRLIICSPKTPSWSSHYIPVPYYIILFSSYHFVKLSLVVQHLVIC